MRVYNNRHWINDVVGGAAIGYMSTAFAYWLYPKIFRKRAALHREELLRRIDPEASAGAYAPARPGQGGVKCFATPYASTASAGLSCLIVF